MRRRRVEQLRLVLAAVLLAAGCTQRPPAPPPGPATPAPPPPLAVPGEPAPGPVPAPPPAPIIPRVPAEDEERGPELFSQWRAGHETDVAAFESFLVYAKVAEVVPTYQLLRSASMWKECKADPFQIPPPEHWDDVRDVLLLLRQLRDARVLPAFEVVSAYRNPKLNRCAGGAPGSSHQRFAVDLAPLNEQDGVRLCRFWRQEGQGWDMGVSRYPTGRIHIDRGGYRTWGASHKRGSSYCLGENS